jgi:hypothetical protein
MVNRRNKAEEREDAVKEVCAAGACAARVSQPAHLATFFLLQTLWRHYSRPQVALLLGTVTIPTSNEMVSGARSRSTLLPPTASGSESRGRL